MIWATTDLAPDLMAGLLPHSGGPAREAAWSTLALHYSTVRAERAGF
jgi:hypothetical protein